MLTFDDSTHSYFWQGKPVPGVTTVLKALHSFEGIPEAIMALAQDRGTAVHLACEYFDRGILDEMSLDERIVGYVQAWKRFRSENVCEWSHIETQCFHPLLRYAGTLDRAGTIKGERWLIDIKTSIASHAVWGVQTSAYANAMSMPNVRRGTVQLRKDGTYRMIEWKSPNDWPVFVSLLTINNFLEQNK
jgi:hypothetical protein